MANKVAIRQCDSYETDLVYQAASEAVRAACDLPALVANKKVLIKPNILLRVTAKRAVCTHPAVIRALIRLCRDAGASQIIVADQPGMQLVENPESAIETSGIAQVCRDEGVRWSSFAAGGYREVEVPSPLKLRKLLVANELLDADFVINVPKIKSHIQALYTGAIKNWFGTISFRDRKRSHQLTKLEPFSESLVDIYSVRPPDLTVMDAVIGMEGRGPSEGKPKLLGLLLASLDGVALDTVALACVDYTKMNVPHVRFAAAQGLGEGELERIEIDGPDIADVRVPFELPPRSFTNPPKIMTKLFYRLYYIEPKILVDKCQLCRSCEKMCPVGAITMSDQAAVIDYETCIGCFCCHESCPHNAIGEQPSFAYRLYRWYERRKHQ